MEIIGTLIFMVFLPLSMALALSLGAAAKKADEAMDRILNEE